MTTTDASIRVTADQLRACRAALETGLTSGLDVDALVASLAEAVVTAVDPTTRFVVVAVEPGGALYVYGPYANAEAAGKAAASGSCATREGTRAAIRPLVPSPKGNKPPAPKASGSKKTTKRGVN